MTPRGSESSLRCRPSDRESATSGGGRNPHRSGSGGSRSSDLPDGQISRLAGDLPVQPYLQKYFCFSAIQIKLYDLLSRPTEEGRHAIVTAAGRDAVDADALLTNGV